MSRHNLSRAGSLFSGKAHLPGYQGNIPGIELQPLVRWRPAGLRAITLAAAPAAGASNQPLAANWAGATLISPLTLSSGQVVQALFKNGSTALPFYGSSPESGALTPVALTSAATTAALAANMPPMAANATAFAASQSVALASAGQPPISAVFNGSAPYVTTYSGVAAASPDVPRNVVAAWTGAAVITVNGFDSAGQAMSETGASGTAFTGNKAFAYVTSISFSAAVTAMTAGFGVKLGLPFKVNPGDIFATQFGDAPDAGTIVYPDLTIPATSATGDPKGTYTAAGALDGLHFVTALINVPDRTTQFGTWGVPQA